MVHGPPGTGKTATLVSLLSTLLMARDGPSGRVGRVWVAAPTNQAVCELARRACEELVATTTVGDADGGGGGGAGGDGGDRV